MTPILLLLTTYELTVQTYEFATREQYFNKARIIANKLNKPMLVIGNPKGRHPCGNVTLDISPSGECPNEVAADVRDIPYPNKYFGSAITMHVLEHLEDPWNAITELQRVSNYVCILYPTRFSILARLHPDHKSLGWLWDNLGNSGIYEYYDEEMMINDI